MLIMKKISFLCFALICLTSIASPAFDSFRSNLASFLMPAPSICAEPDVVAHFSLDDCHSFVNVTSKDYSEFEPEYIDEANCANYGIIGGYLYRNNPEQNIHSCTPGINGTDAMCVNPSASCAFNADDDRAIRIDVRIQANPEDEVILSGLTFFEKAPETYDWILGDSGSNNFPLYYGLRILKNGTEIYFQDSIETAREWGKEYFDFSHVPAFTVSDTSIFNFEILAFCPVENGSPISVWDIDEISLLSCCDACPAEAGTISTTDQTIICVEDGTQDLIEVDLIGQQGEEMIFVVTDKDGLILELTNESTFDFETAGIGTSYIQHLAFDGQIVGLEIGNNINTDIFGCVDISNQIEVTRTITDGGIISTLNETSFCTGDGLADIVELDLNGAIGPEQNWIITDLDGTILNLEDPPFNFEGLDSGTCLIWHVASFEAITEAQIGTNINDLESCFNLSNSIEINRQFVEAGEISTTDETMICSGDGLPDILEIDIVGAQANHLLFIVSRISDGLILETSTSSTFDFESAVSGICQITYAAFHFETDIPESGSFLSELSGCFDLSNAIEIQKSAVNGGSIQTSDALMLCTGDGVEDIVQIDLVDEVGLNSAWIITNVDGEVLELPSGPPFNFEGIESGICQIWHLSYNGTIDGLSLGGSINNLQGCFELSNMIEVVRTQYLGGQISTTDPTSICSGDGEMDLINVNVQDALGPESIFLITDTLNNIIELNDTGVFDFDVAPEGVCYIYHLSYGNTTDLPVIGTNISNFDFCYGISNFIEVVRSEVSTTVITTSSELEICVGDGLSDLVDVEVSGAIANNASWVITDLDQTILDMPLAPPFDFDGAGTGTCLIWHINYNGMLNNLAIGNALSEIEGCHTISEPITVVRKEVVGGTITTTSATSICINEGEAMVDASVSGAEGAQQAWLITDIDGVIIDSPAEPPFDFSNTGTGQCLIWHAAYDDPNLDLEQGADINNFTDCFDLSNPILILKTSVTAAEISTLEETEICTGDGLSDIINIDLTNNSATNGIYIVTDGVGNILDTTTVNAIDFESAGPGICFIWYVSYEGVILGIEPGFNVSSIAGCFAISNSIEVVRTAVFGGSITTNDPTSICSGDGEADLITVGFNNPAEGDSSVFVLTDLDNNILAVQEDPVFDFEPAGPGVCIIWNLSFSESIDVVSLNNLNELTGCFDLSNPILVERISISASSISTTDNTMLCVGDTIPDVVEVDLAGPVGPNDTWVITDTLGNILNIAQDPIFAFTNAGEGVCLIWHLNYHDNLLGLLIDANVSNFEGCYAFSNAIEVIRSEVDGGFIFANGSTSICLSEENLMPLNVSLIDAQGPQGTWIITDELGTIIDTSSGPPFDFSDGPSGICSIQHISHIGDLIGAEIGNSLEDLQGCISFSNEISIERVETRGGNVTTDKEETEVLVCVGDMMPDTVRFLANSEIGPNYQFVVTDEVGTILALPDTNFVDFESNSIGNCRVYGVSYSGIRTMLPGQDLENSSLSTRCFDISDTFLSVKRVEEGEACTGFATMLLGEIEFTLFPNPATEQLFVDIKYIPSVQSDIRVFDVFGKQVLQMEIGLSNPDHIPIDISQLPKGVYILQVYSIGAYKHQAFVIDR